MRSESLMILEAIVAVLAVTTLCARFLPAVEGTFSMDNLRSRIKSWWVIAGVVGAAVLLGRTTVVVLFAMISFVALREFLAAGNTEVDDRRAVIATFTVVLPIQYLLVAFHRSLWLDDFLPALGLPIIFILTALSAHSRNYLARASQLTVGVFFCVYGLSFVPALLDSGHHGSSMLFLLLVTQTSDVLQYVWGKLLGTHKLAPKISPAKTVEGFAGGVISASAIGASLYWLTPFTVGQAAAIALIIAMAGFLGGLVSSAIKRDRGLKDWSRFIPGHGGMLDRVDSLCFSAPVFYHLIRTFFPGSA